MNESDRMSYLIIEAYAKCKKRGHRMDWRRYSNTRADATCLNCGSKAFVWVSYFSNKDENAGSALVYNCTN